MSGFYPDGLSPEAFNEAMDWRDDECRHCRVNLTVSYHEPDCPAFDAPNHLDEPINFNPNEE